ncbi:MAG TPA: 7-carboxy-7-deazaguanine synthase [Syntrophorhabdaceae bacterium]|nr:7-carboxy-7-deazaguanine synthase [Syntrophorhabdaceae bacterium]
MSVYTVKEIFYTLQGEGVQTGRPAVFCRFSGCNLWSGRVEDRARALCGFCDTDFVGADGPGGGIFKDARELAHAIVKVPPAGAHSGRNPLVVLTGGEPALQVDRLLVDTLRAKGLEIAIETNGTLPIPQGIDWITVSPKARARLAVVSGNELKLVYPQQGTSPDLYENLDFQHFLLQPEHGPDREKNVRGAIEYCLSHPRWRLSLQTHKILGIP